MPHETLPVQPGNWESLNEYLRGTRTAVISGGAPAIQGVLDAGKPVLIPSGTTLQIASTVTLRNDTSILIDPGAMIQWAGSNGGTMFTTTTAVPTRRTGILGGGQIDPGSAGIVYDLHSVQESKFGVSLIKAGTATLIVCKLYADAAAGTGGVESSRNSVYNEISINADTCGQVLELSGVDATKIVTLNQFPYIYCGDCRVKGNRHVQWCDNNEFGFVRITLTAAGAQGVIFNDSATPAADVAVYGDHYKTLAIDSFGSLGARKGVVLNWTKQVRIDSYVNDPPAESGAIVNTNSRGHVICLNKTGGVMEEIVNQTIFKSTSGKGGFFPDDSYAIRVVTDAGADAFLVHGLSGTTYMMGPAATNKLYGVDQVTQLVDSVRKTGWTAATGTPTRTTFATGSVTLPVLAEHVKALIDDLISHGLIGT